MEGPRPPCSVNYRMPKQLQHPGQAMFYLSLWGTNTAN